MKTPPGTASLIRYNVRQQGRQTPVELGDDSAWEKRGYASYDSSTSYMPLRVPLALFADAQDHSTLRTPEVF